MPGILTTPNPLQAILRGIALGACIIGLMRLLDLPLDWKISVILLVVIAFASSITFYDRSTATQSRERPEILMQNVHWNFASPVDGDIDGFVAAVSAAQDDGSAWDPGQRIAVRGRLEVQIALYHLDVDPERCIVLESSGDGEWTQGRLLHALHEKLDVAILGNHTLFEGLAKSGKARYHLLLGS